MLKLQHTLQVFQLENEHSRITEHIISFLESDSMLKQVSHADLLERDPDWGLVLGLGYDGVQRQGLIYRHLKKLVESLRMITHGDPMKAKQLSEMLYLRTHSGPYA